MALPLRDKCIEDEFVRPVESIMRCEDFKSSFARRLSNRYSKPPLCNPKQEDPQQRSTPDLLLVPEKVSQSEGCLLNKDVEPQQIEEAVKSLEQAPAASSFIKGTEVTVLNIEIETLRWQLAQTEANRQMHLALLKQVVSFLTRIKEHMQHRSQELNKSLSTKFISKTREEIPRSHSVLHVNKNNTDFTMSPTRKLSSKRSFASVNNVNGLKEFNNWNQSKLSLVPEINSDRKITEEISRLIILANTVLSTKLPELASTSTEDVSKAEDKTFRALPRVAIKETKEKLHLIKEDIASNVYTLNTHGNSNSYDDMTNKYIETKDHAKSFLTLPSSLTSGFENDFASMKLMQSRVRRESNEEKHPKPSRCECIGNMFEDESGFSSMSSFQDIGIPIINIIPPSPNEETSEYSGEFDTAAHNGDLWKPDDESKADEQSVKVFWV